MTAARNIAAQGFNVDLVEATDKLGGNALRLYRTLKGEDVRPFLDDLIGAVIGHDSIRVHYNALIKDVQGFVGNFKTVIAENGGEPLEIAHGVAVIANGAKEWKLMCSGMAPILASGHNWR